MAAQVRPGSPDDHGSGPTQDPRPRTAGRRPADRPPLACDPLFDGQLGDPPRTPSDRDRDRDRDPVLVGLDLRTASATARGLQP